MIDPQRVRALVLHARRSIFGNGIGSRTLVRMGMGSEFDQLRDYQLGDPIRSIDWKSSARADKLIVRSYCDDRNRSIVVALDTSRSCTFSSGTSSTSRSGTSSKEHVMREIGIMVSAAASAARDDLAALFFNRQVEVCQPLRSGSRSAYGLIHQMSTVPFSGSSTLVTPLFATCLARFKKPALIVMITDGLSNDYPALLASVTRRHELVVIRVSDPLERSFPQGVMVDCVDPESGERIASSPFGTRALSVLSERWHREQNELFARHGVAWCDITVGQPYDKALVAFFAQRAGGNTQARRPSEQKSYGSLGV